MARVELESMEGREENQLRSWLDLPIDILELIHSKLLISEHDAFHSVWSSLQPKSYILMSIKKTNITKALFLDPISSSICRETKDLLPQELREAQICHSNFGWLLMHNYADDSIFFFNPVTKDLIMLPNLLEFHPKVACFSSPPMSPDCVVVAIKYESNRAILGSIKRGQASWECYRWSTRVYISPTSPIYYQNKFYLLGDRGHLVCLDPNDISNPILFGKPWSNKLFDRRSYLLEHEGDLISVSIDDEGIRWNVFKMDFEKERWEKVESLGNNMVFINEWGSFSQIAHIKDAGNKIYLPRFYDKKMVFFSMATRKLHTFYDDCIDSLGKDDPGKNKSNHKAYFSSFSIHNTTAWTHCAWVHPIPTSSSFDHTKSLGWSF